MKTLIVRITDNCEDLANHTFPRMSDWELVSEDDNLVEYIWNGEMESAIEQKLNANPNVVEYTIS